MTNWIPEEGDHTLDEDAATSTKYLHNFASPFQLLHIPDNSSTYKQTISLQYHNRQSSNCVSMFYMLHSHTLNWSRESHSSFE